MRSTAGHAVVAATFQLFDWPCCLSMLLIAVICIGEPRECRGQKIADSTSQAEATAETITNDVKLNSRDVKSTQLYFRIKASLDSVRAVDTHDHLQAFDRIPGRVMTTHGRGMTLYSLWSHSYLTRTTRISPWPADRSFDTWWNVAHDDFDDVRATSFYRYLLPAFRDLYDVDFDNITAAQARKLNDQIYANYQTDDWLRAVIVERANIELMFIDPFWNRLQFAREYQFAVPVLNVTTVMRRQSSGPICVSL